MSFALKLSQRFSAFALPAFYASRPRRLDRAGNAAVEFAIIGPVLLLLLMGIFTYGGYFLTAHTIQQLTNDAARASIAGLDDEERLALARGAMQAGIANQSFMRGELSPTSALTRDGEMISVAVTYDASEDVYWAFQSLIPAPPAFHCAPLQHSHRRLLMRIAAFLHARQGGVSILTGLSFIALLGFAGFAIDIGSVYLESGGCRAAPIWPPSRPCRTRRKRKRSPPPPSPPTGGRRARKCVSCAERMRRILIIGLIVGWIIL